MARKEMERTCKRDGTVWYLTVKEAKERPYNSWVRAGTKMQATGSRMSLFGKDPAAELQLANMEAKNARILRNSQCPTCGSTSFKERKVRA
jgi:hypothetical protein